MRETRSFSIRLFPATLLCLVILIAAAPTSPMLAADYNFSIDVAHHQAGLRETPFMRIGANAAPWLPPFIETLRARRPPSFRPMKIVLFRGDANERYVTVLWGRQGSLSMQIEFHKVVDEPDGRRRFLYLRGLSNWSVDLEPPSGVAVFPNEPTIAVVSSFAGGSGANNQDIWLIQMELNTVDITPDWAGRVVDVADIDGDGKYEVVLMDPSWTGYFDGRGAAGPHLPVVLDRINGRFIPACQKYTATYRRWIDRGLDDANDSTNPAVYRAEALAEAYLASIQIAALDEARNLYTRLIDVVRSNPTAMPTGLDADLVRRDYFPLLIMAPQFTKFGCVVGATGKRSVEEMIRFRMDQDGLRRLKAASEAP